MSTRASNIHAAKVYLAMSRHFTRRFRGYSFALLQWAGNARRRAGAEITAMKQRELF